MNCFVTLDIGTSAIKCILISEYGQVLSHKKESNTYFYEDSTKVEFNVEERYKHLCSLIRSVLKNKPDKAKIIAICFTGASGNALLLDEEKKPIGNAISWHDSRAENTYKELLAPFSAQYVHSVCGWPRIDGFPLSIFAWMKENNPDVYYSAKHYATDFVYFNHRLSGNWTMDTSTATTFYLQDQLNMKYHKPFLDFLDIKETNLPHLVKSGEAIGMITRQASLETNLPEGTIVVAGAFDHPTAAIGAGMTHIGDMLISCGTSWVCFVPVKSRDTALKHEMLIDPFLSPEGPWGAMLSFTSIGVKINTYISLLFDDTVHCFEKFEKAVIEQSPTAIQCPFDIMQTEYPPKGYLSKLLNEFDKKQISQSIMMSMAKALRDKIDYMNSIGLTIDRITMVGGFSKIKAWPLIVKDILGLPVTFDPKMEYSGCLGAAVLAGIGAGLYENESEGFKKITSISSVIN